MCDTIFEHVHSLCRSFFLNSAWRPSFSRNYFSHFRSSYTEMSKHVPSYTIHRFANLLILQIKRLMNQTRGWTHNHWYKFRRKRQAGSGGWSWGEEFRPILANPHAPGIVYSRIPSPLSFSVEDCRLPFTVFKRR